MPTAPNVAAPNVDAPSRPYTRELLDQIIEAADGGDPKADEVFWPSSDTTVRAQTYRRAAESAFWGGHYAVVATLYDLVFPDG